MIFSTMGATPNNIKLAKDLITEEHWLQPQGFSENLPSSSIALKDPEGTELKAAVMAIPFSFTDYFDADTGQMRGATGEVTATILARTFFQYL